jgi:hypothetical protein
MTAGQVEHSIPEHTVPKARAWRAARGLVSAEGGTAGGDDLVVRADAAGAANLMREVLLLDALDATLEENDGHWQVVVRNGPHPEAVLARVVDLVASCVERGLMNHATLCVGKRSYTIRAGSDLMMPACAA